MSIAVIEESSKQKKPSFSVSPYAWVWLGVVLMYVLMLIVTPNAASGSSMRASLPYIGILAFAAIGQALVVMQRGLDFSVVGVLLLSGMVAAHLTGNGWPPIFAILVSLGLALLMGLLNGLIVVFLALTPLVATLAINSLYLGLALMLSGGAPVNASADLRSLVRSSILGVPVVFIIVGVFTALMVIFLNRTASGRRFIAVGANTNSARTAGIAVDGYVLLAYVGAGLSYGLAGTLLAAYVGDARMSMGADYLMLSIAAVVLGGTPLTGGRGSVLATFGGAVFMTLLTQFVLALGAPTSLQLLVQAVVLVAAVTLPSLIATIQSNRQRRSSGPPASSPFSPSRERTERE